MNNIIYADAAKEVLHFIGAAGLQICEPICKAIVECKCHKTEAAVAVIKEVTKDMTVFVQISEQFFKAYTKSLELIEKTHQTTVEAYMVIIANDDSLTFEKKVEILAGIQKESNQTVLGSHKILAGTIVAGLAVLGGTYAYGKHCNTVASLAKTAAKKEMAKSASPFAGANEVLFAIADLLKKKTKK